MVIGDLCHPFGVLLAQQRCPRVHTHGYVISLLRGSARTRPEGANHQQPKASAAAPWVLCQQFKPAPCKGNLPFSIVLALTKRIQMDSKNRFSSDKFGWRNHAPKGQLTNSPRQAQRRLGYCSNNSNQRPVRAICRSGCRDAPWHISTAVRGFIAHPVGRKMSR